MADWTQIEDEICLTQLGDFRSMLAQTPHGQKGEAKNNFAAKVLTRKEFNNRTRIAVIEHFEFLDRLTKGEIKDIPEKYKKWNGINIGITNH